MESPEIFNIRLDLFTRYDTKPLYEILNIGVFKFSLKYKKIWPLLHITSVAKVSIAHNDWFGNGC